MIRFVICLIDGLEFCVCLIMLMICVSVVFWFICVVVKIIELDWFNVFVMMVLVWVFFIGIGLLVNIDLLIVDCFLMIFLLMGIFFFGWICIELLCFIFIMVIFILWLFWIIFVVFGCNLIRCLMVFEVCFFVFDLSVNFRLIKLIIIVVVLK